LENGELLVFEERKMEAVHWYFDEVLGTSPNWSNAIDLELLNLTCVDPAGLGDRFIEAEVWVVIKVLLPDKPPGPNGFTARLLQSTWDLIMPDVMATLDAFWCLDMWDLHCVSDALIVLLAKSLEASNIKDYRPISLIHTIDK
jgi:hypothetical protein